MATTITKANESHFSLACRSISCISRFFVHVDPLVLSVQTHAVGYRSIKNTTNQVRKTFSIKKLALNNVGNHG